MMTANPTDRRYTRERTFITRIRLYAQRRVLWMRTLWASEQIEANRELAISHDEVDRILTDPQVMAESEAAFYESDPTAKQIGEQIRLAECWAANDEEWQRLRQAFELSDVESDLLCVAIAVEIEPQLRRVYGYLHDDATMGYATPWLAAALFQWSIGVGLGPESRLVRWRLVSPAEGNSQPWSVTACWIPDPSVVAWLILGQKLDPVLGTAVNWISAREGVGEMCLYPRVLAEIQAFVVALRHQHTHDNIPIEIELIAPSGAGKRTLAKQFCATLGVDLITADASLLLGTEVSLPLAVERVMRAIRLARLNNAVLYWYNFDGTNLKVWQSFQENCGIMLFSAVAPLGLRQDKAIRRIFHLPPLTRRQRSELWQQLTDFMPVPEPVLNWVLTPAEIAEAARITPAGTEAVVAMCQQMLHRGPGELFSPLVCPYTWEDIVLPPTVRQHLAELEEQARLRWHVYEEWGFERLCPLGRGISAMFAGPSGTGKTMAAQVMARSLSMELYRVDLAGVVNKYIGETEKRLKQVFDACERANVLLFFDEADALFGQRTQVKDAHDRFANIEIDYLLQRMEEFDGIAILATNRKGDMDPAFLRRLRFIVDFVQPGPTERLAIWKLALPQKSPSGEGLLEDIDWQLLANRLNMTGADIKGAALGAAFLARSQGTRITMQHVFRAAQREMAKHGVVLRAGEWER